MSARCSECPPECGVCDAKGHCPEHCRARKVTRPRRTKYKSAEQQLWERVEAKMAASVAAGRPPIDFSEAFKALDRHPDGAFLIEDEPPSGGPA